MFWGAHFRVKPQNRLVQDHPRVMHVGGKGLKHDERGELPHRRAPAEEIQEGEWVGLGPWDVALAVGRRERFLESPHHPAHRKRV